MQIRTLAALLVAVPALVSAQAAFRLDAITISQPTMLKEIDTDKAQPSRLAWSPDGTQLYVQTFEGTFLELNQGKGKKIRHSVYSIADGKKEDVSAEPDWARQYWAAKSDRAAVDSPAFKIELKESERVEKTTAVPRGGELARGGGAGGEDSRGAGTDDGSLSAAFNNQRIKVLSMILKGETIGKFENSVIVPGLTYGWGPKGTKAIAFAAQNGRVVIMDEQGTKKEIAGTKDAWLPAWSPDGKTIAWLQKDGRKKYLLQVATVSGS